MGALWSTQTDDRASAGPSKQNAEADHRVIMPNYRGAGDAAEWLQASCDVRFDGESGVYHQTPTPGFTVRTLYTSEVAPRGSAVDLVISTHSIISGSDTLRPLYRAYAKPGSTLIIYCVVPASTATFSIQRDQLDHYFFHNGPEFDGCHVIFLINTEREQPPGFLCMETSDVVNKMRLLELSPAREWTVMDCRHTPELQQTLAAAGGAGALGTASAAETRLRPFRRQTMERCFAWYLALH